VYACLIDSNVKKIGGYVFGDQINDTEGKSSENAAVIHLELKMSTKYMSS